MTTTTDPVCAALATAIQHIEHMSAWIARKNISGMGYAGYSFESLGEDLPGIREALRTRAPLHSGEPVAWLHNITEPGKHNFSMYSASKENPWSHWLASYKDKCTYTVTPLYTSPPAIELDGGVIEGHKNFALLAHEIREARNAYIAGIGKIGNATRKERLSQVLHDEATTIADALETLSALAVPKPGRALNPAAMDVLQTLAQIADDYDAAHERRVRFHADEGRAPGEPLPDGHRVSIAIGDCRRARMALSSVALHDGGE